MTHQHDFSESIAALATPDFHRRVATLDARVAGGELLDEDDRAAALALPWPVYCVWRACALSRAANAEIVIEDEDGSPLARIRWAGDGYEFYSGDGLLLGVAPADAFDGLLSGEGAQS